MSLKLLFAVAVSASLVTMPASAQYMPHLDPNLYMLTVMNMSSGPNSCMTGIAPPENEIAEAREPAPRVMQGYFDAAQRGGAPSLAFRTSGKSQWSHGGVTVPLAQIDAQTDPLAVTGNNLDPEPLRFLRSGNFETAYGQWSVRDSAGNVAGVYDAQFRRQGGEWKLQRLNVIDADERVAPAVQYCAEPGDVTAHKIEAAGNLIAYHTKEITRSEEKLVREQDRLAAAEARLATKPDRVSYRDGAQRARQSVENRQKKLGDLREGLADAEEFLANSNRDVAEIAAMTLPARDAVQLRGFELTTDREAAEKRAAEAAKPATQ